MNQLQKIEFTCWICLSQHLNINLTPKSDHTYDLLTDLELIDKKEQLMKALDNVHTKFGKKKLGVGPYFIPGRNWSMSRDKLSRNPFRWDELPLITK